MSDDQRKREARLLKAQYQAAKSRNPDLRHKTIANGLGIAPSAVAGYFNAHARCPDHALVWIGEFLGFDPTTVRSDVYERIEAGGEEDAARQKLHELVDTVDERKLGEIARFIRFVMQTRT